MIAPKQDNYNKYEQKNKGSIYNRPILKKELFEFLLTRMPKDNCLYAFSKKDLKFKRTAPAREAIAKGKFLYYNQNLTTELIFDIDNLYNTIAWDLDWIYKAFYEKFGLTITWICKTDKGVQFCISLNTFYKLSKKQKRVLSDFKQYIIDNWELIDKAGSKRLKGWWRNPFTHNFKYYGNVLTFSEILDFLRRNKLDIKQQFKTATIKNSIKINNTAIKQKRFFIAGEPVKGNRNNWLWYNTMLYTNSKNFDEVLSVVKELHNKIQEKLDEKELKRIAKSVLEYNQEKPYKQESKKNKKEHKSNWIYGWNVKANWQIGKMGFEKIKGLKREQYLKEVKRRQKMAGREIGKKNLLERNKKVAEQTKEKVYKAIKLLKEKDEKVTIKKVEEIAEVSYLSARKYIKQAKEEGII